jgi:hypothetical protein
MVLESGRAYTSLDTPPVLGRDDLDWIADTLVLSEAQYARLVDLHDAYLAEDWAFRVEHIRPLWEQAADIREAGDPSRALEDAQAIAEIHSRHEQAVARLRLIEERLLTSLAEILSDEQLVLLERVRLKRDRQCAAGLLQTYPALTIELGALLKTLEQRGLDVHPDDPAAFGEILYAYEVELTTAVRVQANATRRSKQRGGVLLAEKASIASAAFEQAMAAAEESVPREQLTKEALRAHWDPAARVRAHDLQQKLDRLHQRQARAARRVHDLNRSYLDLVAAELPDATADALVERFRREAYPVVYPDPFDLSAIFEAALALDSLGEKERADLRSLRLVHQQTAEQIADQMVDRYVDWETYVVEEGGYGHDAYGRYTTEMQRLQSQRRERAHHQIEIIRHVLGDRVADATVQMALERFEDQIERHEQMIARHRPGIGWPPP